MFGAVRPSWIDKEMFYRMPFNFCDRWCERCSLTSLCRVYKDLYKTRRKFIKQGKNPDSLESAFETAGNTFREIKKMLKKDAKKWGIGLDNLEEEIPEKEVSLEDELEKYPLYKLISKYSKKIKDFLEELNYIAFETDNKVIDNLEIINYYQLLLPAKIYRACISKEEEEKMENDTIMDSQTSGFIVARGLKAIITSLFNLLSYPYLKPSGRKITNLIGVSEDLVGLITQEFTPEIKN